MEHKLGEGGETSRSALQQCSLCLRVLTRGARTKMMWYLHKVSVGDEAMPSLQPCSKDKVRRLSKEAKKRARDLTMKTVQYRRRKSTGDIIEEEEAAALTPMRYTPDIPHESCWASLGSTIFCFGSRNRSGFSNDVRCFSLLDDLEKGCEFVPPMTSHRRLGRAVTVHDKIYVFGGTKEVSSGPWAEVLENDGNIWRWRALTEPPFSLNLSDMFALPYIDNGVKKILFGSYHTNGLYTYCPVDDSSVVVDEKFKIRGPRFMDPVVVQKTVHWVGDETIWSYDLDRKIFLSRRTHFWALKDALRLLEVRWRPFALPFLHLRGDIFYLLWEAFDGGRDCPRSEFVLHKFRILKRMDLNGGDGSLSVKPLDMEYVVTDHNFLSFGGMLLSEPNEVVVHEEEEEILMKKKRLSLPKKTKINTVLTTF